MKTKPELIEESEGITFCASPIYDVDRCPLLKGRNDSCIGCAYCVDPSNKSTH